MVYNVDLNAMNDAIAKKVNMTFNHFSEIICICGKMIMKKYIEKIHEKIHCLNLKF